MDFFESRNLEKIHTALFPRIMFVINQNDIEGYRAGYEVFIGKKLASGVVTTILYSSNKPTVSPYGFDYDETANSLETLELLLIKSL